jgi:outer membrane biosynthesis protein TonB
MVVGSNGRVVKLTVVNSSYDAKETERALAVLRQWTFTPAYLRGKYVNVHFTVELTNSKDSVSVHIPDFAEQRGCKFSGFPTY